MRKLVWILLLLFFYMSAYSQQQELAAIDILNNVRYQFAKINDYTVDIHAIIEIPDIQVPPMDVKVYFKQPDKVHFKADGFAMLPRDGMLPNPGKFTEQDYSIISSGMDSLRYKIELSPTKNQTMARKVTLWIDPHRWSIDRIESVSWQGQKTIVNFEHKQIQNKYWLPVKTIAQMNLSGVIGFSRMMMMQQQDNKAPVERTGTITITYSNYKINSGLSDSVFEQQSNFDF